MISVQKSAIVFALGLIFSSCSPGYLIRAAYEEGKILLARKDLEQTIANPETDQVVRDKLTLVKEARIFSQSLNLTPDGSFTSYSDIGREDLSWIVMGAKKDAFILHKWWFPIVGSVPYKGFFDKTEAEATAKELEAQGYETSIRPTDAFSTLGWFNDPILSTTLRRENHRIVNTIIHEIVHSTVWMPDHVAFNESLANYIGDKGAIEFFKMKLAQCAEQTTCSEQFFKYRRAAEISEALDRDLSQALQDLYAELEQLYQSQQSSEQKISSREVIFEKHLNTLKLRYPKLKILSAINNAELMQLKIYLTKYHLFENLYREKNGTWSGFITAIKQIVEKAKEQSRDPFDLL